MVVGLHTETVLQEPAPQAKQSLESQGERMLTPQVSQGRGPVIRRKWTQGVPGRDCSCFQAGPNLVSNRGRVGLAINTCTVGPTPGRTLMFIRLGSTILQPPPCSSREKNFPPFFPFLEWWPGNTGPLGPEALLLQLFQVRQLW